MASCLPRRSDVGLAHLLPLLFSADHLESSRMGSQDCQAEGTRSEARQASVIDLTACAIQDCLSKHNYNEQKCQDYVGNLYRCCAKMYDQNKEQGGKEGKSTACPIESVVRRRMKSIESG